LGLDTQPSSAECEEGASTVDISGDPAFVPGTVDVAFGTTICWRNQDDSTHTVISDAGIFASGDIAPSESYSFTFNIPGVFEYHDGLNPQMTGTVIVDAPPPPLGLQLYCPTGARVIEMRSFGFDPASVGVSSGTIVCWTNQDGWTHTVTSDTGAFDSGLIGLTWTYSLRFDAPGSYAYHDALYPCLTGAVYVDTEPPPSPPPPPSCPPRSAWNCPTGAKVVDVLLPRGFNPETVSVAPGTTVCWRNPDGWTHTVTSDSGLFDSGVIAMGDTYSFGFETTGSYAYHDSLYPSKTGTVNVVDSRSPTSFRVPKVIGLRLPTAKSRIRRSRGSVGRVRRAHSKRVGRVIAQRPLPGKRASRGTRVNLVVGSSR
jgi:plastocyanin